MVSQLLSPGNGQQCEKTMRRSNAYVHVLSARAAADSELLPQVKIIVLLRNPINRAYSHYHQIKQLHREPLSFEDALAAEPSRTEAERARMITDAGFPAWNYRWYSYAERGIYVDQILELRKHFPRENILIMQSEKYFSDTRGG